MNTPGDPVDPEHPAAEASATPGANPAVEPFAPPSESAPFPIVGIGASAGGIEALRAFFHSLPADTGMAFVEEIQASNEELAIVNSELQTRNAQLAESNDDLTNLIGSAQMAIVILGRDLRVRRVTPLAERVLDLSATNIGRPAREIGDRLDVSDLEGMIAAAVDTTISPRDREVRGRDGRWYSLRVRPYRTHQNRVDGAVLVLVDVDNLKRAEEALRESEARFRLLADSAPVLMWVNGLGGCEMVNRAYESFVGVTEPDVQSFEWTRFVHPDDRAAYLAAYLDAFTRRGLFEAELRLRRADGVYRWMRSVGQPRFLAGGEFVGYVGCTYDVNELREAQESLKALDRNKDVFLGVLAHELRNPLGAIRNASYVLGLPGADREVISNAQAVIDRQTRHMTRLVDDLLDISRITQGKIRLALETLSLGDAVAGVVNATEHYRRERRQELILALPKEPMHVRADAARIDQILGNLFINAAKFTPADGHVWVSVERESANTAVIRVRDDGEGIATELLPRIFDLFVQGDVSAADLGSAGIGLALAKQLVVLHGGTIEARSAGALKGSEFVVRLPVADPHAAAPRAPLEVGTAHRGSARRVLIVDDNPDFAQTQAALLQLVGHVVHVTADGASALVAAGEFAPDVVLLDLGLGEGDDGYTVAEKLRRANPGIPAIVAVSGMGRQQDFERSRAAGFDDHLTKPVDAQRLLRLVAAVPSQSPEAEKSAKDEGGPRLDRFGGA